MNIMVKIPRVNNEKILDELVDEMNDEEYEQYQDIWDAFAPWRKGLNWLTRLSLLLLVVGVLFHSSFWIIFAVTIAALLPISGLFLTLMIWVRCGHLIVDIYTRLDRI